MTSKFPLRASLAFLLFAGVTPTPATPLSFDEDALSQAEEDPRTRRTVRLLKLTDGRILRARCHLVDGTWHLLDRPGGLEIPASMIQGVKTEKELKREHARRKKRLRVDDHTERLKMLHWMVGEGLYKESLPSFDKVLISEPDHPIALDLLSRVPYQVPLPIQGPYEDLERERLQRLCAFAAHQTPTAREYVSSLLRDFRDKELLRDVAVHELYAGLELQRAYGSHLLRRLFPGDEQRELLIRAVMDRSEKARRSASLALAKVEPAGIIVPVVRALDSKHSMVQMNAAEALGNIGHAAAVEPLVAALATLSPPQSAAGGSAPASNIFIAEQVAYVSDFDVEIAQGASIADPQINVVASGAAFTARSGGISGYSVIQHRKVIMRSLKKLTGEDPGKKPADWATWWDENQSRWRAKDRSRA